MKVKPTEEIKNFLQPIADEMGIELVDVEFKVSRDPSLTVYIDTEEGVDLDTCEKFHNAIDGKLDELDPSFGAPYTLNVSSPGLDRPLKTERDLQKALGQKLEVKLFSPIKGEKFFEAIMTAYDENVMTFDRGGKELKIERTKIAKLNFAIDFDETDNLE